MNIITRSQDQLMDILLTSADLSYSDRLQIGIEHYIAGLDPAEQPSAWQKLPFLVQFAPVVAQMGFTLPDIRYANPGIYYGGITEYSKQKVYELVADEFTIPHIDLLTMSAPPIDQVITQLESAGISFPIMLKADKGERGVGIYYLLDEQTLRTHRNTIADGSVERYPSTIQQYITYEQEYCLQFYQYQKDGQTIIESGGLTLRDIPVAIGNGSNTIEELIHQLELTDLQKSNIINKIHIQEPSLLSSIPTDGESVTIVRTASLDYGTVYREQQLTSRQEEQLSEILTRILAHSGPDLLGVGRFDIKAPSLDGLLAGDLYIIEMNGVLGIPTHVYDEGYTISEKYAILDKHISMVDMIASQNKKNHIPILSTLGSRPRFLWLSLSSFGKKGLSFWDDSPQKQHIKSIYQHIFTVMKQGREPRWYEKIFSGLRGIRERFLGLFGSSR